jgi:hypothetical protein
MLGFYGFCMLYSILKILIENLFGVGKKTIRRFGSFAIQYVYILFLVILACDGHMLIIVGLDLN